VYITNESANVTTQTNNNVILIANATAANVPVTYTLTTTIAGAQALYGANSSLANLASYYLSIDQASTVYTIPRPSNDAAGLAAALAGMGQLPAGFIVFASYEANGVAETAVVDAFLNATSGRWNYVQQPLFGKAITVSTISFGNATAVTNLISSGAATQNSDYITIGLAADSTPAPIEQILAGYAASIIPIQQANPGYGLTKLPISNVPAPTLGSDVPNYATKLALLNAGYSPFYVNFDSSVVEVEDVVTTNTTNPAGFQDKSYAEFAILCDLEDVNLQTLAYLDRFRNRKVVSDNALATPATGFISADVLKADLLGFSGVLQQNGRIDNLAYTIANTQVAAVPGGRFNIYYPVTLVSANRVTAVRLVFTNS
jgi:hypothetical protein